MWLAQAMRPVLPDAEILLPVAPHPTPRETGRYEWFDGDAPTAASMTLSVAEAAHVLNAYIDHVAASRDVPAERIALIGYSQGAMVSLYAAPRRVRPVGCVVSVAGRLFGGDTLETEENCHCPVLLLHGADDDVVPPAASLDADRILRERGSRVAAIILPKIDHVTIQTPDTPALTVISDYLRDIFSPVLELQSIASGATAKPEIKLVIWDLDDTLWSGTLAEDADVLLHQHRAELVRRFNQHGVISSICSKNDSDAAQRKLVELDLWDEFVFPRIAFVPKGPALVQMIEDMQLRPANVLFIDDNIHNLEEARHLLPELNIVDARTEECDAVLHGILKGNEHVRKSRVAEYKALERRHADRTISQGSREDFLRTCDIHLTIVWRGDLMDFHARIEELINRTNQLNFTRSRVPKGSMAPYISEAAVNECFAVFVWDKYGYHGLVGFASVHVPTSRLVHLAFSCRVMDMGIENWVLARLLQQFPALNCPTPIKIAACMPDWITMERYHDPEIRELIFAHEASAPKPETQILRFMFYCQSGSLAHFSGLRAVSEIDNNRAMPEERSEIGKNLRGMGMATVARNNHVRQSCPPLLILGLAADLWDYLWPPELVSRIDQGLYEECADRFCRFVLERGSRLLVVRMPHRLPHHYYHPAEGVTRERHHRFSHTWSVLRERYPDVVEILDVETFGTVEECIDVGHYGVALLVKLADRLRAWTFSHLDHLTETDRRAIMALMTAEERARFVLQAA